MACIAAADAVCFLGESIGFWIQTGAFFLSALAGVAVIFNNNHRARQRATVDLSLAETNNKDLQLAKDKIIEYQGQNANFKEFACDSVKYKEQNTYIALLLNHHEFIATGIKEGVFDEEIYKRMRRSILLKDYKELTTYIEQLRESWRRPTLFTEFEWLCKRWENSPIPKDLPWHRRVKNYLGM